MRDSLPDRRRTWTQRVLISNKRYYASFGTYPDGRLGEVFVTGPGAFGSYERGVLDTLSRAASISLQHGVPAADVARSLMGINFEPNGPVDGSFAVKSCLSVPDWIGQEILAYYGGDDGRERAISGGVGPCGVTDVQPIG